MARSHLPRRVSASGASINVASLFRRQPVTEPDAELLRAFNPPDPGGEFRAQQSRVRSLIGESSHRRQSLIDSRRREMELF